MYIFIKMMIIASNLFLVLNDFLMKLIYVALPSNQQRACEHLHSAHTPQKLDETF